MQDSSRTTPTIKAQTLKFELHVAKTLKGKMAMFLLQTLGGLGALSYLDLDTILKPLAKKSGNDSGSSEVASSTSSSPSLLSFFTSSNDTDNSTLSRRYGPFHSIFSSVVSFAYLGSATYSLYMLSKLFARDHSYVGGGLFTSRKLQRLEQWKWPVNQFKTRDYFVNNDGLLLFSRSWNEVSGPLSTVKGIVVLLHGLGGHCGIYDETARQFNAKGYIVRSFDMQGHGRSEGDRFFVRKFHDLVEDATAFILALRAEYPNQDMFVMGVSSGALVALLTTEKIQKELRGLVLVNATIKPKPSDSVIEKWRTYIESRIGEFLSHFPLYSNSVEDVVASEQVRSVLVNDPLMMGSFPANTLLEWREAKQWALESGRTIVLPVVMLVGMDDALAPPDQAEVFIKTITGTQDKTLYKIKSGRHGMLLEDKTRSEVVDVSVRWMESKASGTGVAAHWANSVTTSMSNAIKQGLTGKRKSNS